MDRSFDVLLLGAAGSSGHHVARELANRRLSVLLAGRRLEPLEELARELSAAEIESIALDVTDPTAVREAASRARLVLTTVGPFVRYGGTVLDACLDQATNYVDIANELTAVRQVLARNAEAEARGITAVTGAGFGPGGTESLVLDLVGELNEGETPDLVRVATVPANSHVSPGVRETIAALMPEGATTYVDGALVRAPFGTGATVLTFGGARRTMLPGPAGDLEVARLASGAANVSAYFADPSQRVDGDEFSYAYAEVVLKDGKRAAQARAGDGVKAGAAFAAEVARRVLDGTKAGAWTPGRLFGKDLFAESTGATVTRLDTEEV